MERGPPTLQKYAGGRVNCCFSDRKVLLTVIIILVRTDGIITRNILERQLSFGTTPRVSEEVKKSRNEKATKSCGKYQMLVLR